MRLFWVLLAKLTLVLLLFSTQASAQEPWGGELPAEIQGRLASEFPDFFNGGGLADTSFEYAQAMGGRAYAPFTVLDATMDHLRGSLASSSSRFFSFERRQVFRALLTGGQCEAAHNALWKGLVEKHPYLAPFTRDAHFLRRLRWQVYGANLADFTIPGLDQSRVIDLRGLAACFAAAAARHDAAIIDDWANASTIPDVIQRPFTDFAMLVNANGSIHGARDGNYWHLIHMATRGDGGGYGPAGLMLVELALELDSLDLPDDILHMVLLRADQTWPDPDPDQFPLPVRRDRIGELLSITAARLSSAELSNAERCAMTDEPYNRLLLGEAAHAALPDEEWC